MKEYLKHMILKLEKGDMLKTKQGKMVKEGDEYIEGTVRPDIGWQDERF